MQDIVMSSQFSICSQYVSSRWRFKNKDVWENSRGSSKRVSVPHPQGHGRWVPDAGANFLKACKYVKVHRLPRPIRCLDNPWSYEKKHGLEREDPEKEISTIPAEVEKLRNLVKARLDSVDEGDMNTSAYETAWVALVEDVQEGTATPQFPSCLRWIADNQLPDGSWGDKDHFSAYDRLINTLACAIALKRWNRNPHQIEKGLEFVRENMCKLKDEEFWHMTVAFEILFPALMDLAKKLEMKVPDDDEIPILQQIYASRTKKLQRIPRHILHTVHTTLLFSLEGLTDLEWEKLMKLQSPDGSFLNSLSCTAFALAKTKDTKCFNFIEKIIERFDGGVPYVYPLDLFTRIWIVDRLHRLGVSRYFEAELKEFMSYVYRHWTEKGIYSTRDSPLPDMDDTAMGWWLLRLYGYDVSPDVLEQFRNGDVFVCFELESTESVTSVFNLYRASQVLFPGEKILEDAKSYSFNFLQKRHSENQIFDKWLICKDLPGEVAFALDMPWYACLPRIETRFFLEQYGGGSDIWIGKVLYRMYDINNDDYLKLGKLDYNYCQSIHQCEWNDMQTWFTDNNMQAFGIRREDFLVAYFVSSASIFEPERSNERIAWAKTSVLIEIISKHLQNEEYFHEQREALINEIDTFKYDIDGHHNSSKATKGSIATFLRSTIQDLSLETLDERHRYVHYHLCDAWKNWLMAWNDRRERCPEEAQLLVRSIVTCSGRFTEKEMLLLQHRYKCLSYLTNEICHQLRPQKNTELDWVDDDSSTSKSGNNDVDKDMQELVKQVLLNPRNVIDSSIKQTFLIVAKSFYYKNLFSHDMIMSHVDKVLFNSMV